jgi:hypothetical protein
LTREEPRPVAVKEQPQFKKTDEDATRGIKEHYEQQLKLSKDAEAKM